VILVLAVALGLATGLARIWFGSNRALQLPGLRLLGLVLVAFLLYWLAFRWPISRSLIADRVAAMILVAAQAILLIFVWANRHQSGMWLLGLGLGLNLLVISLNGGLMPISPETVHRLAPTAPGGSWQVGERLWSGKDIVLPRDETILAPLSDQWLTPPGFPIQVAFSIGDVLIAMGVFWLLWNMSERQVPQSDTGHNRPFGWKGKPRHEE
jgi:hypothetical protein